MQHPQNKNLCVMAQIPAVFIYLLIVKAYLKEFDKLLRYFIYKIVVAVNCVHQVSLEFGYLAMLPHFQSDMHDLMTR